MANTKLTCETCNTSMSFPNKGLGRAKAYSWLTNHQGHDVKEKNS